MALTKTTTDDKIEIVTEFKQIQVRTATVIKEDGVELSRNYHRKVLHPGILDASDNLVDTDLTNESSDVRVVCEGIWTTTIKDAWKAKLIADKPVLTS